MQLKATGENIELIFEIALRVALWTTLGVACLTPVVPALAQGRDMGCSPTVANPCRVPSPSPAPAASGSRAPSYDHEAARRAQEAAADAERKRRAEEDRTERERLAGEKRKKEEQDAEFIRERDATASTLRGTAIGARASPNDGGLIGSGTVDTGLRELRSGDRVARDQQGPQAAWKQLHCAAALSGYAFAALNKAMPGKPTENFQHPDYQEFSYLAGQASKAMAGEALGVECGKAPPMPDLRGNAADWDRIRQNQRRMLERASKLVERVQAGQQARAKYEPARTLTPDEQRIQEAYRQQQANQARIAQRDAPVIAAQIAINRSQERKYDAEDAAAIREEQKAKAEIDKYVDASKKLESGDATAMLNLGISDDAPPPRSRRQGVTTPSRER